MRQSDIDITYQAPSSSEVVIHGSPIAPKRFECTAAGCKKLFRRKEHLTRHQKSHNNVLQYVCHICGRRYARSDVLKRHVEFHPQYYKARRSFVACIRCRESKTKCDEESPCKPCSRRSVPCVRGNGNNASNNNDSALDSSSSSRSPSNSLPPSHNPNSQGPTSISTLTSTNLKQLLERYSDAFERRLTLYNTEIHPLWPVLLAPESITATEDALADVLIMTIAMLASWLEGDDDHLTLFPLVFDEICEFQLCLSPMLPTLQAMALCLLYMLSNLVTEGMITKALKVHSNLITACRFGGILAPQGGIWYSCSNVRDGEGEQEQRCRLAFAVLRLDAYLSALTDFPPMVRHQELSMPLSQSTCWARGIFSEEERRRLVEAEPSMRKSTPFSFRVHDLLGTPRPNALASPWTEMDYHFVLCAVQTGAWEAAHQALRSFPDSLHSRSMPKDVRSIWRDNLEVWKYSVERDCQLHENYFKNPMSEPITLQTLLLYHITCLKLNAPPYLWSLQGRYYKPHKTTSSSYPYRSTSTSTPDSKDLSAWQTLRCARLAVWHSAKIARIVTCGYALGAPQDSSHSSYSSSSSSFQPWRHALRSRHPDNNNHIQSQDPTLAPTLAPAPTSMAMRLNPLTTPALLMSARVMCGFVEHTRACPGCRPTNELLDLINVLEAPAECQRMTRWIEEGAGILDWGGGLFTISPVCRCHRKSLADWFRKQLARCGDARAETVLMEFNEELDAGLW